MKAGQRRGFVMLSFIKEWITGIIVLLILIILMEMLLPSGRIRKFANLATGFILIIAIINPPLKYFGSQSKPGDLAVLRENQINRAIVEIDSKMLEEKQAKQIVEVYRLKIIKQLEGLLKDVEGVDSAKADVIINEDYNSPSFGEIKRVYLEVSQKEDGTSGSIAKVQRINIKNTPNDAQNGAVAGNNKGEPISQIIEGEIKERINALYGVKYENIVISNRRSEANEID
jgi:stage III sporulation protein AF